MKKIAVIGSLNMDYILEVPRRPGAGETVLCRDLKLLPGGKGANQAYAAGKLGGNAAMLGVIGSDGPGDALLASLSSVGVDISRVKRDPQFPTGSAFIQVDGTGENSITVAQGANLAATPDYLEENRDFLEACDLWVFQLEIPLETAAYGIRLGHSLGKTVILDPAPARVDLPPDLFAQIDFLKPNEWEAALLSGVSPQEPERAAELLRRRGAKNVLVTLGAQGAILLDGQGKLSRFPADTSIPVADTTAAGDSFTGALAKALADGASSEEAADYAIHVSCLTVSKKGAQPSIPTPEEVDRYISGKNP